MAKFRLWAAGLLFLIPIVGAACIAIGANGKRVSVSSETAIIVWDSKAHIERFTRSATFETDAKDLGFLVPTPTLPTLAKANPDAFQTLLDIVEDHLRPHEDTAAGAMAESKADDPVLSVTHVAGYEATALSLANPKIVGDWLKSHGYPKTQAAAQWLAPYEEKRWVLTAFRVIAKDGTAGLSPVQMTFHADVPFYPYREPTGGSSAQRSLRVFFLSDAGVEGRMAGKPWVAKTELSGKLTDYEIGRLQSSMPGIALAQYPWLTSFLDTSSPRIGTDDVFFTKRATISTPLIIVTIVVLNVLYFSLRIRRRKRLRAS